MLPFSAATKRASEDDAPKGAANSKANKANVIARMRGTSMWGQASPSPGIAGSGGRGGLQSPACIVSAPPSSVRFGARGQGQSDAARAAHLVCVRRGVDRLEGLSRPHGATV